VIQAETSKESNPSEVLKITEEELITESTNDTDSARFVEAPIETCSIETQIIEDKETPKPILVKEEPLEKKIPVIIAASNDENDDRELNKQDPPPEKKPRRSKEADSNTSSEQVEKFTCKICLHQFNKQTELVIHNRKHVREQRDVKPDVLLSGWFLDAIKCLQCRKTFPTPEELKAHTSKEHKCDAYCPICGMRFRNNDVLEQHRKRAKRCLKNPDEPSKTR
ncbi:AAEL015148-PA, partial [Aedes aegypti]